MGFQRASEGVGVSRVYWGLQGLYVLRGQKMYRKHCGVLEDS